MKKIVYFSSMLFLWVISFSTLNGQTAIKDEPTSESLARDATETLVKVSKVDSLTARKFYKFELNHNIEIKALRKERLDGKITEEEFQEKKKTLISKYRNDVKQILTDQQYKEYFSYMDGLLKKRQ